MKRRSFYVSFLLRWRGLTSCMAVCHQKPKKSQKLNFLRSMEAKIAPHHHWLTDCLTDCSAKLLTNSRNLPLLCFYKIRKVPLNFPSSQNMYMHTYIHTYIPCTCIHIYIPITSIPYTPFFTFFTPSKHTPPCTFARFATRWSLSPYRTHTYIVHYTYVRRYIHARFLHSLCRSYTSYNRLGKCDQLLQENKCTTAPTQYIITVLHCHFMWKWDFLIL